jgi:hypothetical protein
MARKSVGCHFDTSGILETWKCLTGAGVSPYMASMDEVAYRESRICLAARQSSRLSASRIPGTRWDHDAEQARQGSGPALDRVLIQPRPALLDGVIGSLP